MQRYDRCVTAEPDKLRVAVIVSRYNATITDRLEAGAREAYAEAEGADGPLEVIHAPGAFELPQLAGAAARSGRFDAIVALGCLLRGETSHDRHIARAVATGLTEVAIRFGLPVAFGVLTVDTPEQAEARAGGARGNKGAEAMRAALQALGAARAIESGRPAPPSDRGPDKMARWSRP